MAHTLEQMTWEERFAVAWQALLKMECRAEDAEARVAALEQDIEYAVLRGRLRASKTRRG